MDDIDTLITQAATSVKEDMETRPVTGADGIWRFDRICESQFGKGYNHPKEFWLEVEKRARKLNAGKDTWDRAGFGIVASFAQTRAAYATPGFAEARSKYMT